MMPKLPPISPVNNETKMTMCNVRYFYESPDGWVGSWNEEAIKKMLADYGRAVAEACAEIVEEHRGPIEIYNKRYPAFFECAKAIREAVQEIK